MCQRPTKLSFHTTLLILFALLFLLGGCVNAPQPVVKIEYVAVYPDDNLLVNCDVAAPPKKADYLQVTPAPVPQLLQDNVYFLAYHAQVAKTYQERERLLTNLNLKQYQYADVCNQRWVKLRQLKADALKEISQRNKE